MIVRMDDVRKAGYCVRGIREWAKLNGFDFNDFHKNGIEHEKLAVLEDAMAQRVVALKLSRGND